MLKDMTRVRLILLWFAAVAVAVAVGVVLGASLSISTTVILLALSLVPPAIVLLVWPGDQPQTVAEVLHDVERRL